MIPMHQRLLITGSTGFLGGAIVSELVGTDQWDDVLLLVRAQNEQAGKQRVLAMLERFALPERLMQRLSERQIICGDLADSAALRADTRLGAVTDVINCAAFASFSNHPDIPRTNASGTEVFAKALMGAARLRRFIQVGTAMSCGADAPNPVPEGYDPGERSVQLVPYTASKLEGERRLKALGARLPLVIVRPSIIVGHTKLGCRPSPSIFWVFRMARALRSFPCAREDRIDIVPVDYCAQAILRLLRAPSLSWSEYHVSAAEERSCTFGEIDDAIARALGLPPIEDYRQASYEEMLAMQGCFDERLGPCIRPAVLRAIQLYGQFASLNLAFDNRRLLEEGVPAPPRFDQYAGICAATAERDPISQQMLYDFKGLGDRAKRLLSLDT
jgi:nucleoside-diphosphate-sugar epimerase